MKYIRVKADGFIYEWNPIMAKSQDCEVITEEQAYPERFLTTAQKSRESRLSLHTKVIPVAPKYTSPELAAQVAKGMP